MPLYYDDPLIKINIPEDAFINLEDFTEFADLESFLISMTYEMWLEYRANILVFLSTSDFKYSAEYLAKKIFKNLQSNGF